MYQNTSKDTAVGIELDEQDEFNIMDFNKKWTIHDTIWKGKKKLIKDFSRLKIVDDHAVQVINFAFV